MSDETSGHKTWREKISELLLREPKDREELIEVLHESKDRHLLDDDALKMIEGVLHVSEMNVRDVMIPRPQMTVINSNETPEQALPTIIESAHSRFPVIGDNRDKILGILLAKDLLPFVSLQEPSDKKIADIMRPAIFIPESKRLDILLKEFRLNRNHMAIVVDEYGGIAGLVTIEDVLEQIVGNIEDEYDIEEEASIKPMYKNVFSVKALTTIQEFNEYFNTDFDHEDFDTVGGLVLQEFSHVPKKGERITLDNLEIKVVRADSRGVDLLRVKKLKKD